MPNVAKRQFKLSLIILSILIKMTAPATRLRESPGALVIGAVPFEGERCSNTILTGSQTKADNTGAYARAMPTPTSEAEGRSEDQVVTVLFGNQPK